MIEKVFDRIQAWVYVLAAIGAIAFWVVTMNGIPPRVTKLEVQVSEHEKRLNQNEVKLDIILDDVKTIKGFILHRHGGE